jgi:hypothetical protein
MIATIPPLWRDADAYVQATQNPLVATFWGHAPAYCQVVKVPLFLGEQLERLRGNIAARRTDPSQPALTDSGIWLLIIGQHLALGIAIFCFIRAITNIFWIRLALALTWASNALFYTFAHCVGSETLGMIFIIVLALKALRLIQKGEEAGWTDWYVFAVILLLCLLSRDLNLGLVALLPAAFLISSALKMIAKQSRRSRASADFRQAAIAIAVGIACIAIARSVPQGLARNSRLHPHSRLGFTFLWRLHFLSDLSADSRTALLRKVSAGTQSEDVRKLIALLGQMHDEKADLLNPGPFMERAIPLFGGSLYWENLDRSLNKMAFAFLLPPTAPYLHAAKKDLVEALEMPPAEISAFLFASTTYYFKHKEDMPGCATLVTFRDTNADQIWSIPFQHVYFRLWQSLSYKKALAGWLVTLLAFIFASRRKLNSTTVTAFGIALVAVGLFIVAATCLLDEFSPRFGLPMWQLLFLSLLLFVGMTADLLTERRSTR